MLQCDEAPPSKNDVTRIRGRLVTIGRQCALTRGRWMSGCAGTFWRKKCRGFCFSDSNCLSGPGWAGVGAAHANRRKKCNYHACVLLGVRLCVGGCVLRDRPHVRGRRARAAIWRLRYTYAQTPQIWCLLLEIIWGHACMRCITARVNLCRHGPC